MRPITQYISLVCAGLMLAACARKTDDTSTKISINVPQQLVSQSIQQKDVGTLSTSCGAATCLQHLTINVTGPGLPGPIVVNLDSCDYCTGASLPSQISIDVPSGTGRLIQIIAVYQSGGSSSSTIEYGDMYFDAIGPQANVPVSVFPLYSGILRDGRISGRFLDATNVGPTGHVAVQFNPGGGKPWMTVEESEIINGWFSFFALENVPLNYVIVAGPSAGRVLFPNFQFSQVGPSLQYPTSAYLMKVGIPDNIFRYDSGMAAWMSQAQGSYYVYGFFDSVGGSLASAGMVCFSATSYTLTRLSSASSGSPNLTFPAGMVGGGPSGGTTSCTQGAVVYTLNQINFLPEILNGNGNDGASSMAGMFSYFNTSTSTPVIMQSALFAAGTPTPFAYYVKFAPVDSTLFNVNTDTINIYTMTTAGSFYFQNHIPCSELDAGLVPGFTKVAEGIGASQYFSSGGYLYMNVSFPPPGGNQSYLGCIRKSGILMPDGFRIQ